MNELVALYNEVCKHIPYEEFHIVQVKTDKADGLPFEMLENEMVFQCHLKHSKIYKDFFGVRNFIEVEGVRVLAQLVEKKRKELQHLNNTKMSPFMQDIDVPDYEGTFYIHDITVLNEELDGRYDDYEDEIYILSDYLDHISEAIANARNSFPF